MLNYIKNHLIMLKLSINNTLIKTDAQTDLV